MALLSTVRKITVEIHPTDFDRILLHTDYTPTFTGAEGLTLSFTAPNGEGLNYVRKLLPNTDIEVKFMKTEPMTVSMPGIGHSY